jgi:transposase
MKGKVVLENTIKCAVTLDFLMFRIWLDDNGDFLLLLIVDGHRSNLRLDFIQNAREANVSVAKLPSHTPLDVSCFKALKTSWDNALVSYQRKENCIDVLHKWPPYSPDLNVIENLWAYIKMKVRRENIASKENLRVRVLETWQSQELKELCGRLVASMKKRIILCIKNKGGYIKY